VPIADVGVREVPGVEVDPEGPVEKFIPDVPDE
jgi:hypothetical protein